MKAISGRITATLGAVLVTCLPLAVSAQQVPAGYPGDYTKIIEAAKQEGKVVVYGATDAAAANPLIKDFEAMYPGVKVEYNDMNTTELYNRLISEKAAGAGSADVTWSSAMDLQVKLVEMPQTHADLPKMLGIDRFKGKLTSYDIEKSGVGFLLITQDAKAAPAFWDIPKTFGATGARFYSSSGTMMERLSSGEHLVAYNLIGTYAILRAKKDPSIGIVMPKDYTLVMSRIMFISKQAKNPNAAKLWLDYILSKRGQTIIANQSDLGSIRADVEGEVTLGSLTKTLGASLKPIPVGPSLLTYLDQAKRLEFLKQWQQALKGQH